MQRYACGSGLQQRTVARPCIRQQSCRPARALVRPLAYRTSAREAGLTPEQVKACQKKYEDEYNAVSSRLTGVVRRAVNASVTDVLLRQQAAHHAEHTPASSSEAGVIREVGGISSQLWEATERVDRATGIGRRLGAGEAAEAAAAVRQETDEQEVPEDWSSATPCEMASAFMRCLNEQMSELRYGTGADEEADEVLGAFPSSALLSSSGGGVQAVIEKVSQATSIARGPAGPAAVRALRSLTAAVGRIATQPNVYVPRDKASSVMTCLTGIAEALEGAVRHTTTATGAADDPELSPSSSVDFWAEYVEYAAQQRGTALHPAATAAAEAHESGVSLEAAALLREAAAVLDCIASKSCDLPSRQAAAAAVLNAPSHPLMSLLETRLYAGASWRSDSAAEIAASLVDLLAYALSPARAGNTLAPSGREARNMACSTLRALASAQKSLAGTLRDHDADPASASRLLAALAEALGAAAIARDTFNPTRGPRPVAMFGEAQLLAGLSRMCTGEAMAMAAQSHDSINITPSDASLVLEVLAEQGRVVAEAHREQISQVLNALRAVPTSLRELAQLPGELMVQQQAAAAASAARAARRAASTATGSAAETLNLLRRTAAGYGPVAAAGAAAAVADDTQSGLGGTIAQQQQQQQQQTDASKSSS
ncbi:hypothetical protein CHLRE_02g087100v5 [Chlamydomonas reinhardtii]|uniref:Uncharacterized protein n=1 Tax=Chlamydomonas reinhardtii TaxID=3055 RepID=A0A2K3E100_CHLRE|nr:uncharacterized protein CHLRE_02g087100v5 [Chlamydomonas reinhardtii]PNW86456.1 hypothetical protein CHLRE_02g087100v5 [Chlamydomonas reinhardtii]